MNLLEFIHFIYKDFDLISIKLTNGTVVYDGSISAMLLDNILFLVYHEVYMNKFYFNEYRVEVRIR